MPACFAVVALIFAAGAAHTLVALIFAAGAAHTLRSKSCLKAYAELFESLVSIKRSVCHSEPTQVLGNVWRGGLEGPPTAGIGWQTFETRLHWTMPWQAQKQPLLRKVLALASQRLEKGCVSTRRMSWLSTRHP